MPVVVFAAEPTAVQLTWGRLPAPEMVVEVAGRSFEVGGAAPRWYPRRDARRSGPGALVVDGLEPATDYEVTVRADGRPRSLALTARTAAAPPGRVLSRFATVSDCHIGERRFGAVWRMSDRGSEQAGLDPYPLRALRAARTEAVAWGAEHLLARGDVTRHGWAAEAQRAAVELLGGGIPASAVLGNHDVEGAADLATILADAGVTASHPDRPAAVDLPGVRLVLGHTPVQGLHRGQLAAGHLDRLVDLVGAAPGPAVVALHHPPRSGGPPTYYPPGLTPTDSRQLVDRLAGANPAVVVLCGHTHRTRRYDVGRLPVSEVGSTKDYPGQWAGYTVYEGGLAQVVRRIATPDVIAWTEMTGRALGGQWGRWSPGRLSDRSWAYEWPVRRRAAGR